jgi:hypothetical protein
MAKKNHSPLWTPEEYAKALDMYFGGSGLATISHHLNRTPRAVEDLIRHDIPRNYRSVIVKIAKRERSGAWHANEVDYLRILDGHGLTREQVCHVLGRSPEEVQEELDRTKPRIRRKE